MGKEVVIGGILGMVFGSAGLYIASTFGPYLSGSLDSQTAGVFFLFFSLLFGARAGYRIKKGKRSVLEGLTSSVFTMLSSNLVFACITEMGDGASFSTNFIDGFVGLTFFSLIIGGVPILFIGSIFGISLKFLIKKTAV